METKMLEIKGAITAFFSVLGLFLGWKGVLAICWLIAMALDYVTGSVAARKNGEWDSARAREGLAHKGGMIAVVLVALLTDAALAIVAMQLPILNVTWPGLLLPLVLVWYIITELGSILENAVKLGATVPEWLTRGLKITLENVDKAGEGAADKLEGDPHE